MAASPNRLPSFFLAHGGGPMPLLGDPSHASLIKHWKHLRTGQTQPGMTGMILCLLRIKALDCF